MVATIEDLLHEDPDAAVGTAAGVVPDFVAEMDRLAPTVAAGCGRPALSDYWSAVDSAAKRLTALPAEGHEAAELVTTGYLLLNRNTAELLWTAPTVDGAGLLTALVDRFRVVVGGMERPPRRRATALDRAAFHWIVETLADVEFEHRVTDPLRRAMTTLSLKSSDIAELMGVTRQAVDKWLRSGVPPERLDRLGVLAEVADILRHRLRDGMPAIVARRAADAYGGRTMLEMIAEGEHKELLESVRASFDYARVA